MKPLAGVRVIVTRAESQAANLAQAFREVGADVRLLPLLEILPPEDLSELQQAADLAVHHPFDWWVFTSANAVRAFLPLLPREVSSPTRCAAVGAATEAALVAAGYRVERRPAPDRSDAEGLGQILAPDVLGRRILIPLADDARPTLGDALRRAGAKVYPVVAYRKVLPATARARAADLFRQPPWGWVTVTSPRVARNLRLVIGEPWDTGWSSLRAVSIGPVTSTALRGFGIEPAAQAAEPSSRGLVEAVLRNP